MTKPLDQSTEDDFMLSRKLRLLIVGAIITATVLGTLILDAPQPTLTLSQLEDSIESRIGDEIAVRGEVKDGTINNETMTFILEGETEFTIIIDFADASVSNGLGDNRTVYAEGILLFEQGEYYLQSSVIKTSCPSKYEEESTN